MSTHSPQVPEAEPAEVRILVVDDEEIIREMLFAYLTEEGHLADMAKDGPEALEMIARTPYAVVITDIRMPGANGMEVLKAAKQADPDAEVIVMTAFSTEDLAIEAVRLGAYDYLKKPVEDLALFGYLVRKVIEKQRLARNNRRLAADLKLKNTELESANEKLMSMATTDPLTGVYNRRYILARLEQQFRQTARYGEPFALVILDLDHFKNVNDTHGHQVGDELLKHFARTVRALVRDTDLFGRYGGEEFLLILHGADLEDAYQTADRLRARIADTPLVRADTAISVTVSMGLVPAPHPEIEGPEMMVRRADAALYRAKSEGRNRVVIADQSTLSEPALAGSAGV